MVSQPIQTGRGLYYGAPVFAKMLQLQRKLGGRPQMKAASEFIYAGREAMFYIIFRRFSTSCLCALLMGISFPLMNNPFSLILLILSILMI